MMKGIGTVGLDQELGDWTRSRETRTGSWGLVHGAWALGSRLTWPGGPGELGKGK
jgi:hypothetical protein